MIEIVSKKGEKYGFDQATDRIFKDGLVVPSTMAEAIYTMPDGEKPEFCGILLKDSNSILTLSGNINPITNSGAIQ